MTRFSVPILALFALVACSSPMSLEGAAAQHPGSRIAVVSISANNYANSLQGWNAARTSDLMGSRVAKMLGAAERTLGAKWKVVPAKQFVGKRSFQRQKGQKFDVGLAKLRNGTLPVFAGDRKQLIKAHLEPAQAKALAKATGADLVAVIYSEWTVATGKFVPTAKALTKNVVSIYSATGERIYHARKDQIGRRTLGAWGRVVVNEGTIDQWVDSYEVAVTSLLQ
jgi:hypothetical protein